MNGTVHYSIVTHHAYHVNHGIYINYSSPKPQHQIGVLKTTTSNKESIICAFMNRTCHSIHRTTNLNPILFYEHNIIIVEYKTKQIR